MLKYELFCKPYKLNCIFIVAGKHPEENFKDYDVYAIGLYSNAIDLYLRLLPLSST